MLRESDYKLLKECIDALNEKTEFKKLRNYRHHNNTSTYHHSIGVAYFSVWLMRCFKIKCDTKTMIYGALLHDYYLYNHNENETPFHWFRHPKISVENAKRDWEINKIQENIIKRHMFPLTLVPPRYRESVIVSVADKLCAVYEFFTTNPYKEYVIVHRVV